MRPRVILFLIGICVLLLGILPLIANLIPAAATWIEGLPPAGSVIYQALLVLLGIIAIGYSFKRPKIKK